MAFNFNWSPLMADPSFYTRAREMLTSSLNKSPKPPIIVDDILVNELNLGSVPPDLEILEIGDLAQDKFRGIFKMCYSGDAYLTLKTRVQANPLNTYLASRPSFASPEPLAAHSGLTIPLQITLSEIKLSAFIILVFSKQKGLTLVFRNDPLESLKVSSTFDSIPFVRDYLQKTIEQQLRSLLMDELPAIIHRLSLRLWVPEFQTSQEREEDAAAEEIRTDPLASPPQDPVDSAGHALDANEIASLSLDSSIETQSLFSHRNVLRLAALSDSQRTLSLFTPHMQEVVYRVWAGSIEKSEHGASVMPPWPMSSRSTSPLLSRHQSSASLSRKQSVSSDSAILQQSTQTIRPALVSHGVSYMSTASTTKAGKPRRKKHRIINLRRKATDTFDDNASIFSGSSYTPTLSSSATTSDYAASEPLPQIREGEMTTPPVSPEKKRQGLQPDSGIDETPRRSDTIRSSRRAHDVSKVLQYSPEPTSPLAYDETIKPSRFRERTNDSGRSYALAEKQPQSASTPLLSAPFPYAESSPGGVLEQAWMMKMANEIARRVQAQNETAGSASRRGASTLGSSKHWMGLEHQSARTEDAPPPAYAL